MKSSKLTIQFLKVILNELCIFFNNIEILKYCDNMLSESIAKVNKAFLKKLTYF